MKNVVVMPNFKEGDSGDATFVINCKTAWKKWCHANGCEFIEITTPITSFDSIPPQMQKMWVMDILVENNIEFDQIAQVDYDTFPLPHCPNFFNQTNDNFTGVLDNGFGPQLNRSVQMVKNNWYPNTDVNWDNYFNSGFIVYSKKHIEVFKAVQEFYFKKREEWCSANKSTSLSDDQTLLNFIVRDMGFDITLLGRSFNVLDWHCRNFFSNYQDELGREINAVNSITNCVNIFHITGDTNFRDQATDFLINNFYK